VFVRVANTRLRLQSGKGHGHSHGAKEPAKDEKPYKGTVTPPSSSLQNSYAFSGLWDAMTRIAQEEGVTALWNGAQASLVLVSNPTIHFVVRCHFSIFSMVLQW